MDFDRLGLLADTVDNLIAAEQLPLPQHIAKQARIASLTSLRDDLREMTAEGLGYNPWTADE